MSDLSVTEMPEYLEGLAWAAENMDRLRERFTGTDLQTQDLRDILWGAAQELYPEQRESMENDLKATAFVAGSLYRLTQMMEDSPEGLIAVSEMAMEMGSIFGAEAGKHEALESLKAKPLSWWRKKFGAASPNDLMKPIYTKWWREVGNSENRKRTTKWEALKHTLGSREMRAFEALKNVTLEGEGGVYVTYDVDGEGGGFQMMAKDAVHPGGIVSQQAGEIVG